MSSTDPSRRRIFAPAGNTGSSSKQKNPVGGESVVSKEAMVSLCHSLFVLCHIYCVDPVSNCWWLRLVYIYFMDGWPRSRFKF